MRLIQACGRPLWVVSEIDARLEAAQLTPEQNVYWGSASAGLLDVRLGDTVVDVGANVGSFAALAAHAVGVSGAVYAIEPLPEVVVPRDATERWRPPTAAELCSHWHANGDVALDPSQVCISVNRINWAMRDKNPLDHVRFFNKFSDTVSLRLEATNMTSLMAANFEEVSLRVYSKVRGSRVAAALNAALQAYSRRTFGSKVELATPCRNGGPPPGLPDNAGPVDFARLRAAVTNAVHAGPPQAAPSDAASFQGPGQVAEGMMEAALEEGLRHPAKRRRSLYEEFEDVVAAGL